MDEFEDKLNAILGSQEAMGQIMALARSLSGGGAEGKGPPPPPPPPEHEERESAAGGTAAQSPDLAALLGQMDPAALQAGVRLLREYQGGDSRNAALLTALRPFLKEDRRARLDKAIQLARVIRLIRAALGTAGGEEGEGRV